MHFKHWQYEFKVFPTKIKCLQTFSSSAIPAAHSEIAFRLLDAPLMLVIHLNFTDHNGWCPLCTAVYLFIIFLPSPLNIWPVASLCLPLPNCPWSHTSRGFFQHSSRCLCQDFACRFTKKFHFLSLRPDASDMLIFAACAVMYNLQLYYYMHFSLYPMIWITSSTVRKPWIKLRYWFMSLPMTT